MCHFSFALPVTQDIKEGKGLKLSTLIVTLQADLLSLGCLERKRQAGEYTVPGWVQLEKHYFARKNWGL